MSCRCRVVLAAALLGSVTAAAGGCTNNPEFDLVVSGGSVIDGTGAAARLADVGIKGDRVTALGNLTGRRTSAAIDAAGKVVAPGFIDVQSRSGVSLLVDGFGESHLRQGITTELLGESSPAFWTPSTADADALRRAGLTSGWDGLGGYFTTLQARGSTVNVGTLVPLSLAPATQSERSAFLDQAMQSGAFGVSDDVNADARELGAAAAVSGRHGGTLMWRSENPATTNDASLLSIGAQAHRIVISGISRVPPGASMTSLITSMVAAGQRQITVYGALTPYAEAPGTGETTVHDALKSGSMMIGTDSSAVAAAAAAPGTHPAAFGTFPRLLGQLVRDQHLVDLTEAVRRSTSMPASVFGITQRGIIRQDYFADLVVFDPRTVADRATVQKPNEYPTGIEYVIVNGVVTLTPAGLTGSRPGYRLLHRDMSR